MREHEGLLHVDSISLSFSGLRALDGVSLAVDEHELVGVIGPNGSGKSTLFNVISGIYRADEGRIDFGGKSIQNLALAEIVSLGLARTFQNKRLFGSMSALDNVAVAALREQQGTALGDVLGLARSRGGRRASLDLASDCLSRVGLSSSSHILARDLSFGAQNRLEIARAMAMRPKLLLLDEPAAGLNVEERRDLQTLIHHMFESGISILLVEHDVRLVTGLCSRVIAIDHGITIADGRPSDVVADPRVQEAYFGPEDDLDDDIAS
jgi:branched-chain amino acid transport system ATP-binding protein